MTREAAVAAAEHGWYVFPCRPGDKRPMVDQWEKRACCDPRRVRKWWPEGANVGIACGPSRLVVVDLDTHGTLPLGWRDEPGVRDGLDVLATLAMRAGQPWPDTCTVTTPSGGWHLYFRAPAGAEIRNSAGKIGPLIDVRAHGGYVVGAGSSILGVGYSYIVPPPARDLPPWLLVLIDPAPGPVGTAPVTPLIPRNAPGRLRALAEAVQRSPEGNRNASLNWAAYKAAELVETGEATPEDVAAVLGAAAAAAGLAERETRLTISSGLRAGKAAS